jgi:tRNA pseudouridine13 synthase
MKLKQQPNDFLVEEISNISISQDQRSHSIFIMEKTELDTFNAIRIISKKTKIPIFEIGYAGLKDKHAITKQYISIPSKYNIKILVCNNLNLNFIGYSNKKIKIGDLKGNKFSIVARDIKPNKIDNIYKKTKSFSLFGVPNYFDSQRFGSVFNNEFIGKHLVKKNYETAVKIFLTCYLKSEKKNMKNEKRNILKNWSKLENITIRNKVFAQIINEYIKTNSWLDAYKKIPANIREMHINAYQSYLWNECIKEILRVCINGKKIYSVQYAAGILYFYKDLSKEELSKIPSMFPTLSEKVKLSEFDNKIVSKILSNEKITIQDLNIKNLTGNFFKTRKRQIIIIPENFNISSAMDDELNIINGKPQKKIILSFFLSKGSYATVITKKIFNQ